MSSLSAVTQEEYARVYVRSIIVKKVLLWRNFLFFKLPYIKYRYFFDVRNVGEAPFDGNVTIRLYRDKWGIPLGEKVFVANEHIQPKTGVPVHMDINTGPTHVYGRFGVSRFEYVVDYGDETVPGQGHISEKYEELL